MMSCTRAGVFIVAIFLAVLRGNATLLLPNTSGIDGHLTADLKVDHFFSLWLVFNNDDVKMSGEWFESSSSLLNYDRNEFNRRLKCCGEENGKYRLVIIFLQLS